MILRHSIAIFFGTIAIYLMHTYFETNFDAVASVGLFSCICAVVGEDTSLGPVIYKSFYRSVGVCFGGICGYILLFIPILLFPDTKNICLIFVPTMFITLVQWISKGGNSYITKALKKHKAGHIIIQLQVAFGVVYVGSWDVPKNALGVAIFRTSAILVGCISLLLASLIAYPQTSLNAISFELATCLRTLGKLITTVTHDRACGVALAPYDHRGKVFDTALLDDHIVMLDSVDSKLSRGTCALLFIHTMCLCLCFSLYSPPHTLCALHVAV